MTKAGHLITGFGLSVLFGFSPFAGTFGAIFPDYDIFIAKLFGTWKANRKRSLLTAHRGVTHHFLFIPLFLLLSFYLREGNLIYFLLASFLFGYAVHLIGDLLTPLGLPYRLSYHPRIAYPLFKTGSWREYIFLFVFSAGFGFLLLDTGSIEKMIAHLFSLPVMVYEQLINP